MNTTIQSLRREAAHARPLPLLHMRKGTRIVAWRQGQPIDAGTFLGHVRTVAATLPSAAHAVNLCEDRYAFLVAFCAVVAAGQTNLLPPSRAPHAVDEVMAAHPGCYALGDLDSNSDVPSHYVPLPPLLESLCEPQAAVPMIPAGHIAAIGYTSGSTGKPQANAKTWAQFHLSNAGNLDMLMRAVDPAFHIVATVPPQHMYGMETSVLLPLLSDASVHAGRPFFPADIAHALASVPAPRVLVSTPVHLRTLVRAGHRLPSLAAVISATAPLPVDLARDVEAQLQAPLLEVFGSTETCVFASRRTAQASVWTLYPGVELHPQPDGTQIRAPQLDRMVTLADLVELRDDGFVLRGRNTDLLEIGGKRASLEDLNRRLLGIHGVEDGIVIQLDAATGGVRRVAALVVAPTLSEADVMDALRRSMDPVFLPRPLRKIAALPRNETGKLPRHRLMQLLRPAEDGED